ncbi:hypothetical protein FRB98_005868 [Tulasnella sp. 332]|nr:hypothetical protein FRB98_005868 [Tulasnella sp. 332]
MSVPPNTELVTDGDNVAYIWVLTPLERAHIASLLGVDASIIRKGPFMAQERTSCQSCGKYSGLDDLVHSALSAGIHCKDFILDVLVNGTEAEGPARTMICSTCKESFKGEFHWMPARWMAEPPRTHDVVA